MSNTMHQLDYSNDLFFKYTLSREDEGSVYVRNIIIERVTGIRVKESTALNPNLGPGIIEKKRIILDVHVEDEQNRHSNTEMQMTCRGIAEMMRFEFYGTRALSNQSKSDEFYDQLKPVYQIILIDEYAWNDRNLINHYQMRNEQGEDESGYPLTLCTSVHIPAVNDIVEEKEIRGLNDFEQLVYLFENNEKNDILKPKERLVRVLMNKYEEMQKDDELWSIVMAVQVGEARYRNSLRDSFEEGKTAGEMKGKIEDKLEGERRLLYKLIKIKYHEGRVMWLQALTEEQMHIVSTLLLERNTLESFRKRLHNVDMK